MPREAGHSARTRLQGASSKQTLPAPPGAQLPGPGRAGRGRAVPRRQPAALSPGPAPVPRPPAASPRSRRRPPGADRLPAGSGQRGSPHTCTCAPPSARTTLRSSPPPARAPALARARRPGRSRERRGSARCRRIVSRLPYISSRARGSGTGGGPYGTSPAPPRPSRSTGGGGGVPAPPLQATLSHSILFPVPLEINCTLGSAEQAAS